MTCETVVMDEAGFGRLAARLVDRVDRAGADGRRAVVGIGGVAGSGKSTLAGRLAERVGGTVVFGLDGFHLPNARLRELGRYERKGAPDTYDAEGFVRMLQRYQDASVNGPYPVYDRQRTHEPVTAPRPVDGAVRLIVAEGQFVLLDRPPWDRLAGLLDESWFLDTPVDRARGWILQRHTATGRTAAEALVKYENDLRNAGTVLAHLRAPDLRLVHPGFESEDVRDRAGRG